jgi:C2H2-type zinc-finger domain/Zinc finger, C2H2 type
VATINKSKCPDCGARFKTVQMMTIHRRKAHGVLGQSHSSIAKRLLENPQPVANPAPNQCKFCGLQAKSKAGLSLHVRTYHVSKEEVKPLTGIEKRANSVERLKGKFPCPHCDFIASWTGGLTLHISKKHPEGSVTIERTTKAEVTAITRTSRAAQEESHAAPNGYAPSIPEGTLALALGRFQGLCQSMAVEFDLPPRLFAARLAELVYRSQIR